MSTTLEYTPGRWSLDELFTGDSSPELKAAFEELGKLVDAFEKKRDLLTPAIPTSGFLDLVSELEKISRLAQHVNYYAGLRFAADTQDQAAQALVARVEQFMAEMQNKTLFFSLWWKDLDDENAARLMEASGDYHYWLEEMRNFKPHTLSEPEEKIVNIKDVTGSSALQNLYDAITNRYVYNLDVDGERKELTRGELMVYVRGSDPDLRAAAYQELYRVYGEEGPILGQLYQYLVRDWGNEQINLRKFSTPISARNLANDIPDPVVDTLLDVSERNAVLFQRYFRLKARWLGVEKLRRYDVYAPVAESDKTYPFNQATELVLDAFSDFDPRLAKLARRVFDEKHLDSEVRKGKRSGAFCASATNDLTPWVLLNYQGRADDVATMAHELGHAIHTMLASHHSLFTFHASLPLAETASTFGEMMLIDRLLQEERDEAVRRDLLFRQVDDSYATIMRQVYFALFERTAHEMVKQGSSVDELADAYMQNLAKQFGDALEIGEEFRWEWVSIPHIYHTPFYVYAYAFGQLLVFSLYQQFKAEGDSFKPRYLDILSAGGSDAPERVLSRAGIDIRSEEFWQGGYDVVAGLLDQLESLPVMES